MKDKNTDQIDDIREDPFEEYFCAVLFPCIITCIHGRASTSKAGVPGLKNSSPSGRGLSDTMSLW